MVDARLHALEQPQRLQQCAQSGLGKDFRARGGHPRSQCVRWNVVQLEASQ